MGNSLSQEECTELCNKEVKETKDECKDEVLNEFKEEYTELIIEIMMDDEFHQELIDKIRDDLENSLAYEEDLQDEYTKNVKQNVINSRMEDANYFLERFKRKFTEERNVDGKQLDGPGRVRKKMDEQFLPRVKERLIYADDTTKKNNVKKIMGELFYTVFIKPQHKDIKRETNELIYNLKYRPDFCTNMCDDCNTTEIQNDYKDLTNKNSLYDYAAKYSNACNTCKSGYGKVSNDTFAGQIAEVGGRDRDNVEVTKCLKTSEIPEATRIAGQHHGLPHPLMAKIWEGFENDDEDVSFNKLVFFVIVIALVLSYFCK